MYIFFSQPSVNKDYLVIRRKQIKCANCSCCNLVKKRRVPITNQIREFRVVVDRQTLQKYDESNHSGKTKQTIRGLLLIVTQYGHSRLTNKPYNSRIKFPKIGVFLTGNISYKTFTKCRQNNFKFATFL